MWLMTVKGFVSVVEWRVPGKDKRNGLLVVRARERQTLAEIVSRLEAPRPKIIESKGSDYRFRFWIMRDQFKEMLGILADDVTYTNFKSAVLNEQGATPYEKALHQVWSIMGKLQPGGPYGWWGKGKATKLPAQPKCQDCGHEGPKREFELWQGRVLCKSVSDCVRRMNLSLPVG